MGKSSPPSPPDPVATAQAQGQANVETARVQGSLNNLNQYTPYGSVQYQQIAPDRWAQYVNLSPAEQQAYNTGSQLRNSALQIGLNQVGQVGQTLSTPFSLQGAPQAQYNINTPSMTYGSQAQQQAYIDQLKGQRSGIGDQRQAFQQQANQAGKRTERLEGRMEGLDARGEQAQRQYDRLLGKSEQMAAKGKLKPGLQRRIDERGQEIQQYTQKQGQLAGKLSQYGQQAELAEQGLSGLQDTKQSLRDQIQAAKAAPTLDPNTGKQSAREVGDALYRQQERMLDPQFQQQQRALQSQLAAQGATPGTAAYDAAMGNFSDSQMRAYGDARDRAIVGRGAEQSRLFGQDLAAAQFGNQAAGQSFNQQMQQAGLANSGRQQYIQEQLLERQLPMNELAAFYNMSGVQMPQFGTPPGANVAPTDVAGIYNNNYQGQLAAYQAQQSASPLGSIFGAIGQIGAAMPWSDRRLKERIVRIGMLDNGIPIYAYSFKADPDTRHIGVMAQEVREVRPDAVIEDPSGFLKVDYLKLSEPA